METLVWAVGNATAAHLRTVKGIRLSNLEVERPLRIQQTDFGKFLHAGDDGRRKYSDVDVLSVDTAVTEPNVAPRGSTATTLGELSLQVRPVQIQVN